MCPVEKVSGSLTRYDVTHCSLTHWLRRANRTVPVFELKHILQATSVSQYLGALPHTLRSRVSPIDIGAATYLFHDALDEFLNNHIYELRQMWTVNVYNLPDIGALFDTPCMLECRNYTPNTYDYVWWGAVGTVCRISFPEIGARYALKIFRTDDYKSAHGPWYEIPAALRAYHAEPRDNVRMHMASLGNIKYMLSDWVDGDYEYTPCIRPNKYEIFFTAETEVHSGNYRGGRRLDFGKTYRTVYGAAPYNVRKQYRAIVYLVDCWLRRSGPAYTAQIVAAHINAPRGVIAAQEMDAAVKLLKCCGPLRCQKILGEISR